MRHRPRRPRWGILALAALYLPGCASVHRGWREDLRAFEHYGSKIGIAASNENDALRHLRNAWSEGIPDWDFWHSVQAGWNADFNPDG